MIFENGYLETMIQRSFGKDKDIIEDRTKNQDRTEDEVGNKDG
jgi:hypothetical protein